MQPVIVFVNPNAELDVAGSNVPAVPLKTLKQRLRSTTGDEAMPKETYKALVNLFGEQAG